MWFFKFLFYAAVMLLAAPFLPVVGLFFLGVFLASALKGPDKTKVK